MLRAVRLATLGLCATVALLTAPPALAQTTPDYKTWLFAEGSTNSTFGFEQEVLIGNPNPTPVDVRIEMFSQDGTNLGFVDRTIPALARYGEYVREIAGNQAGVALKVTSSLPIVAERSMYWGNGLYRLARNGGRINDMRGGHNERGIDSGARTWYFAEGEARFFWTFFAVANPNDTPAAVTVRYLDLNGNEVSETRQVRAKGRETFWPSDPDFLRSARYASRTGGFSTIIESDIDVVAERQMYWGPAGGYDGGHAALGIKSLATDWFFAEGFQGGGTNFDTWLLVLNPNSTAVDVTYTFFDVAGATLATLTRSVGPRARAQVWGGEFDQLRGKAFSTRVTSTGPIAAERAVYWRGYAEGHATAGATQASRKWGFAEGLQGGFGLYQDAADRDKRRFNTFYAVFNPNNAPATVTFDFYVESPAGNTGKRVVRTVPANSRYTLWTLEVPELAHEMFAAFLSSDQPIVAERVVYWGANFRSGHASLGTPLAADFPIVEAPNTPALPGTAIAVSPAQGPPGGGTTVTITGQGFGHGELGTQVLFGATPATSFEVENDTTISAVSPAGSTGKVDVTVVTNGTTITAPQAFTYFDPNLAGPPVSFGDLYGVIESIAAARPFELLFSCTEHGSPNSNTFMFEVVAELRLRFNTNRWGLNWKRGNRGDLSQDIVNYYSGTEGTAMRDSTSVRIYDIIGGHCGNRPSPFWVDQTAATRAAGAIGRWTTDPMCRIGRYRDAKRPNGEWLFPECR